jgi:hypothetical protein
MSQPPRSFHRKSSLGEEIPVAIYTLVRLHRRHPHPSRPRHFDREPAGAGVRGAAGMAAGYRGQKRECQPMRHVMDDKSRQCDAHSEPEARDGDFALARPVVRGRLSVRNDRLPSNPKKLRYFSISRGQSRYHRRLFLQGAEIRLPGSSKEFPLSAKGNPCPMPPHPIIRPH